MCIAAMAVSWFECAYEEDGKPEMERARAGLVPGINRGCPLEPETREQELSSPGTSSRAWNDHRGTEEGRSCDFSLDDPRRGERRRSKAHVVIATRNVVMMVRGDRQSSRLRDKMWKSSSQVWCPY